MSRSFVYIFLILLLPSYQAYGDKLADAMIMTSKGSDLTRNERSAIAKSFNNECKQLLELVPLLSPKENQWLDNEINNGRTETISKTSEFAKRALRNLFSTCIDGATHILNSNNHIDEALGWSILLSVLGEMDIDYYMNNSRVGVLKNKSEETASIFRLTSINVPRNILIPLLKKKH